MSGPLVLGVDGGGTSTVCWLADASGRVLGRGSAGPSNAKAIGPDRARRALGEAIARAKSAAGVGDDPAAVAVACLGLAGFDRPDDRALLASWCDADGWAGRFLAMNDGDLVLAAGTPDGAGIALIAGTGSIAVGRSQEGRTVRSGGWGPLIGDEGSGYAVALAGLRLVARRFDGRSTPPAVDRLTESLCGHVGATSPRDLIPILYGGDWDRARIAGLAPMVVAASVEDREVFETILRPAASELAATVIAVRRALEWDAPGPPPLALAGGFLLASGAMAGELLDRLDGRVGEVARVPEPVLGAVVLARRALG